MAFGGAEPGRSAGLDELAAVVDWAPLAKWLDGIYASPRGEAAWPPLALLEALLSGFRYDLSDVKLAEALDDHPGEPPGR